MLTYADCLIILHEEFCRISTLSVSSLTYSSDSGPEAFNNEQTSLLAFTKPQKLKLTFAQFDKMDAQIVSLSYLMKQNLIRLEIRESLEQLR